MQGCCPVRAITGEFIRIILAVLLASTLANCATTSPSLPGPGISVTGSGPRLIHATVSRQHSRVRELLEAGADPNTSYPGGYWHGDRPLHFAVRNGDLRAVYLLLRNGADVNARNANGETPLITAIDERSVDLIQILLNEGADPSLPTKNGLTPLHVAADRGLARIVRDLLIRNVEVDAKTDDGLTPLMVACKRYEPIVRLLIEAGADVNARTRSGTTPIMYASHTGSLKIVQLLVESGAEIGHRRVDSKDALYYAFFPHMYHFDRPGTLQFLLQHIDVDRRYTDSKSTLLMLSSAFYYGDDWQTGFLLRNGADPTARDADGARAVDYCRREDCRAALQEAMKDRGATGKPETGPAVEQHRQDEKREEPRRQDEKRQEDQQDGPWTRDWLKQRLDSGAKPAPMSRAVLHAYDGELSENGTEALQLLLTKLEGTLSQNLVTEIWPLINFENPRTSFYSRYQHKDAEKQAAVTEHPLIDSLLAREMVGYPIGAACTRALYAYLDAGGNPRPAPFQGFYFYDQSLLSKIWFCPDAKQRMHRLIEAGALHPDLAGEFYSDLIRFNMLDEFLIRKLGAKGFGPDHQYKYLAQRPLCTAIDLGKTESVRLLRNFTSNQTCFRNEEGPLSARVYAMRHAPKASRKEIVALLPATRQSELEELISQGSPARLATYLKLNQEANLDLVQLEGLLGLDERMARASLHRLIGTEPMIAYALNQRNRELARIALENDSNHAVPLADVTYRFPEFLPDLLRQRSDWSKEELEDALIAAVHQGNVEAAQLLIQAGASVRMLVWNSYSLLHLARDNPKMYLFLKRQGAESMPNDQPPEFSLPSKNETDRLIEDSRELREQTEEIQPRIKPLP